MALLSWYWHRCRAMSAAELALRGRKKLREVADARYAGHGSIGAFGPGARYPVLPLSDAAPEIVRRTLARDADLILSGRWKAFGHLELTVTDPPEWQRDYVRGQDFATGASAFELDHRALPGGADVKLIWELSRWHHLVRLAMAAYVLDHLPSLAKCLAWLEHWVEQNPPYRGWNWISALEVGMRLIQFTWIDALLAAAGRRQGSGGSAAAQLTDARLERLRSVLLPPHVRYAWRHRSFGSSANNHLLGELAGCIVAAARWPALQAWCAPLPTLQAHWEREVLAQFAEDGGNREQALSYHLYSLELCWQTAGALAGAGLPVSEPVLERLRGAAGFFSAVQVRADPWDYGDSDGAFVTPVHADNAVPEWHRWFADPSSSAAIDYWLGTFPLVLKSQELHLTGSTAVGHWCVFRATGLAIRVEEPWHLRWDLTPLGYLSTAAHGHVDALHLSIWFDTVAIVIDPGVGAYYAEPELRAWLASRAAHNGPCPAGVDQPRRVGPFLWTAHHARPSVTTDGPSLVGTVDAAGVRAVRRVVPLAAGQGWQVEDQCLHGSRRDVPFDVRWQFAPESRVQQVAERTFSVHRRHVTLQVEVSEDWEVVQLVAPPSALLPTGAPHHPPFDGVVSPAFRKVALAPVLKLAARPVAAPARQYRTTFSAGAKA